MFGLILGAFLLGGMLFAWWILARIFNLAARNGAIENQWEIHVVLASVAWGALLVVVVEFLSLVNQLSLPGCTAAWWTVSLFLVLVLKKIFPGAPVLKPIAEKIRYWELARPWTNWSTELKFLVWGTVLVAALSAFIALSTAPTELEALSIHMPRILHWIQNQSVGAFENEDLRLFQLPPWSDYARLHLYFASGGDRLVNLVSWVSMVLSLVAVMWISQEVFRRLLQAGYLEDRHRTKAWASWIIITLPLGLVHSFTTLPDFPAASWLLAAIVCGLLLNQNSNNILYAIFLNIALALVMLTIPTQNLFILLLVFIGWPQLQILLSTPFPFQGQNFLPKLLPFLLLVPWIIRALPYASRIVGNTTELAAIVTYTLPHTILVCSAAFFLSVTLPQTTRKTTLTILVGTVFALILLWALRNNSAVTFTIVFLLLLSPTAAFLLANRAKVVIRGFMGVSLGALALFAALNNPSRPFLSGSEFAYQPREQQYFLRAPHLYEPALEVAKDLAASKSTNVALNLPANLRAFEYPLWAMLKNRGFTGKLIHSSVTNRTAKFKSDSPPSVLLTSVQTPSEDPAQFPHSSTYPPYTLSWTEQASHWAQVGVINLDGEHPLPPRGASIDFSASRAVFFCRVPRQGVLTLRGSFLSDQRPVTWPSSIALHSYAGFSIVKSSTNGSHLLDVALPPGQTAIRLVAELPRGTNLVFGAIHWEWLATDEPLPFAFITRFMDIKVPGSANPYLLQQSESRKLELVAGGKGSLDIMFDRELGAGQSLLVSNSLLSTNIVFGSNLTPLRVPVERGTNHFVVTNPAGNSPVELKNLELRFRELAE